MVKLYDLNHPEYGYLEVEVEEFYSNDYPQFFARKGKNTYVRDFFTPIYDVPIMTWGNKPSDGGNLILSPEERDELIAKNPASQKWIRKYLGAKEFIFVWQARKPPHVATPKPRGYFKNVANLRAIIFWCRVSAATVANTYQSITCRATLFAATPTL